jgi:hypothetical protein
MSDFLFPSAYVILDEAKERHQNVWPFVFEAIDLAHRAFERGRDLISPFVPGIPKIVRVRNDINDDCWRFLRSVAEPLIEAGYINEFATEDGGEIVRMCDGLRVRIKKGCSDGGTSNYPTPKIVGSRVAVQQQLYAAATELDSYIQEGLGIDVVYVAGAAMAEYTQIGLRYTNASVSPFTILDPPTENRLQSISPGAAELVAEAKARLLA